MWLHFLNIFDSNDHKANIIISFPISGLFTPQFVTFGNTQAASNQTNYIFVFTLMSYVKIY